MSAIAPTDRALGRLWVRRIRTVLGTVRPDEQYTHARQALARATRSTR